MPAHVSLPTLCIAIAILLADEREMVQKKTFTKWVNSHLARVGFKRGDLYLDLRDGKMLIKLLEVLSGEKLVSFTLLLCATRCTGALHHDVEVSWPSKHGES